MLGYLVSCRAADGTPLDPATLKPTWRYLKALDGLADVPGPEFVPFGPGFFVCYFDPEAHGDCAGQVDLGESVTSPERRYIDIGFYRSEWRTTANLDARVSSVPALTWSQSPQFRVGLVFERLTP